MWAGDSRAYLFREGQLIQLTRDHSQVQDLMDRGMLTAAEAVARAALELVFAALGEAWDAGRLHAALSDIAAIPAESAPAQAVWAIEAEDGTRIEMPGRFPQGLVERMLELAE
jgi:serine/threonine protein phosphatase PrpC